MYNDYNITKLNANQIFLVLEQNFDPKKKGASTVCTSKVFICQ